MGWPATRDARFARAWVEAMLERRQAGFLADLLIAMASEDFWGEGALAETLAAQIGPGSNEAPVTAAFLRKVARKIAPKGAV